MINPLIETPKWCIEKLKEDPNFSRGSVILDCRNFEVPYSYNPTFSPVLIALLDFVCLGFFLYFRWYKTTWEKKKEKRKLRNYLLTLAVVIIVIENVVTMILFRRPILSIVLRPVVFGCFLHLVRLNFRHFYHDLKDSATILGTIFLFIVLYALIGFFLFRYSFEGY